MSTVDSDARNNHVTTADYILWAINFSVPSSSKALSEDNIRKHADKITYIKPEKYAKEHFFIFDQYN
jgi:hypothetical protein